MGFVKILPLTFSLKLIVPFSSVMLHLKLIEDEKESARLQKMSKRRGKMVAFEERVSHSDSEVRNNMCTTHFDGYTCFYLFIYFVKSKANCL